MEKLGETSRDRRGKAGAGEAGVVEGAEQRRVVRHEVKALEVAGIDQVGPYRAVKTLALL